MLRRFARLCLLALCLLPPAAALADEEFGGPARDAKIAFLNGDFDRLEELSKQLLDAKERTEHGDWKRSEFYRPFIQPQMIYGALNRQVLDRLYMQGAKWLQARPESATAQIVMAMTIRHQAWLDRGGGYVSELTTDQLTSFSGKLKLATRNMLFNKPFSTQDPEWYALLLELLTEAGASPELFDSVSEEALRAFPNYAAIDFAIVRRNLPNWGGSRQSLEAAVERIVAAASPNGDMFYAWAYAEATRQYYGGRLFTDTDVDWKRMKQGFEAIAQAYPSNWNLNKFARFACFAEDREATAKLFARLGDAIDDRVWDTPGSAEFCLRWSTPI